ncbi:MAG: DUF4276 family protein [Chloroflexia bacterium]|nr:DUF4276 family protein [Chloroflexia bacterium]
MKNEIVEILVEEPSMRNFLNELLPKILPEGYILNGNCFIRAHQGKHDLQKSIPRKVIAFQHQSTPYKVIIVQDQDSNDCKVLKSHLQSLIVDNSPVPVLIRIVCRELESWYIGDMKAISMVYSGFKAERYINWAKFRIPDNCNASDELRKLIPTFQKGYASKEISRYIDIDNNKSESFNQFVSGIKRFLS